jgi:alpha-beta hydrolase superfamily lysophospholipase
MESTPAQPSRTRRIATRIAKVLLATSLCGFILLNILAYRHAYAMTHFSRSLQRTRDPEKMTLPQIASTLFSGVEIARPRTKLSPADLSPEARALTIPETNGIRLGAWYAPGATNKPLVILYHGYIGEKGGTIREARAFLEMGCSVLLVDFRGSGESSESDTTIGCKEAEDVTAAYEYAREHLPAHRTVLYGQSMGAAAVLRALHDCGVHPDGVIIEAVFDRLLTTVKHRFTRMHVPTFPSAQLLVFWGGWQSGFNGFRHNPVDYAAAVHCPSLFLHGSDDSRARVGEARAVFERVPGRKQFEVFTGAEHESGIKRFSTQWKTAVRKFIEELN